MLYRLFHAISVWYPLAVLGLYIAAFLLGFALLFVFPQITLLLVFLGMAGLGFAVIGSRLVQRLERRIALGLLRAGICPQCRQGGQPGLDSGSIWQCRRCGTVFEPSGSQVDAAGT